MERTETGTTSTDSPPHTAPESLVLSAHTLGILARHVAQRLRHDPAAQAFTDALEDAATLAEDWVSAQLDAHDTRPQPPAQPADAPLVAPTVAPVAPPPAHPAAEAQPLTATAAVLAATSQLDHGATARDIAQHIAAHHQLAVTPGSVRAILSRHRREQPAAAPQHTQQPEQWAGGYA